MRKRGGKPKDRTQLPSLGEYAEEELKYVIRKSLNPMGN